MRMVKDAGVMGLISSVFYFTMNMIIVYTVGNDYWHIFSSLVETCRNAGLFIWYNVSMKKQKYNNKAVYVGADRFDSKRELARYRELQAMEKAGTIQNLERQVAFPLIDKSEYGRTIKYVADFVYWQDGYKVVEDVKSYITAKNPVYRLKKRLLAERYGIVLHEVF